MSTQTLFFLLMEPEWRFSSNLAVKSFCEPESQGGGEAEAGPWFSPWLEPFCRVPLVPLETQLQALLNTSSKLRENLQ
jgi:hypothetical protein